MEFKEIENLINYQFNNINLLKNAFNFDEVLTSEGNLF